MILGGRGYRASDISAGYWVGGAIGLPSPDSDISAGYWVGGAIGLPSPDSDISARYWVGGAIGLPFHLCTCFFLFSSLHTFDLLYLCVCVCVCV